MTEREQRLLIELRDARYWWEHKTYNLESLSGLQHITPTLIAMQRKGWVGDNRKRGSQRMWHITDAGREALTAEEARDGR